VLRKGHIIIILVIAISFVTVLSIEAQQDFNIPQWVKNNALWWGQGDISDADFISGMKFLIDQKVLQVSTTEDDEWEVEARKLYKENQPLDKKYMEKVFMFSMWQPENWEKQAVSPHPFDAGLSVYSMIESSTFDEAQATTIAVVIDDMEGLSLEEYNEAQLNKYGYLLSTIGVEFLDAGRDTTAGEKDIWYEYTYDIQLEDRMFDPVSINVKLKGMDVIIGHGDVAYTITYLTSEKNYDKHYDEFLDILDTFKFL
jgi:hypothetical protein